MTTTEITEQKGLATVAAPAKAGLIAMGDGGLRLSSLDDAYRFAQYIVKAGLAPKGFDTAEKALIAMQAGAELGFKYTQSLRAMVVVNGKPSLYGEAALGLIHDRKVCSRPPVLGISGDGDERYGFCRFQRKDMPETIETTFSVADAKKAQLWGKVGRSGEPSAWVTYPDDMLQWRAFARACKRYFSDVTLGLVIVEELQDYPPDMSMNNVTPPEGPDPLLAATQQVETSGAVDTDAMPLSAAATHENEPPIDAEVIEDPEPLETRADLLTKIMFSGTALFGKKKAQADLEVSAATGGKVQSVNDLDSKATDEQLRAVLAHFETLKEA